MFQPHAGSFYIRIALGFLILLGPGGLAMGARGDHSFSPVQWDFPSDRIPCSWETEVAPGGMIDATTEGLVIESDYRSSACLKIPLSQDLIRAGLQLLPGGEEDRWAASLYVVWDENNWCQFYPARSEKGTYGVWYGSKGGGYYRAAERIDGVLQFHDVTPAYHPQWHRLAIEIALDGIRYLYSADGGQWIPLRIRDRPLEWKGRPPKWFIVGKGFPIGLNAIEEGAGEPPPSVRTKSTIRRIFIHSTPPEGLSLTDAERKGLSDPLTDWLGLEEMQGAGDPTYESVSSHYPPMKFPREVIGLKDHPQDIGVPFDGSLQLQNFHTGNHLDREAPAAYFEIGDPGKRLGWEIGSCQKRLLDGYLPIVICDYSEEGLLLEQTMFGYSDRLDLKEPLSALIRMKVSNPSPSSCEMKLRYYMQPQGHSIEWDLFLKANEQKKLFLKVPWDASSLSEVDAPEFEDKLRIVKDYWRGNLSKGMSIEVPEPRVMEAYRAWLAYNFLNVDWEDPGFLTPDGAGFYDALYGYAACQYTRVLDAWGYREDAEKYLASNLARVRQDGLFFTHFGLPDTATMLLALADHYRLTGDRAWLRSVAPKMVKMCEWVMNRREADRAEAPELVKGMVFFQTYADYPTPTYSYFTDSCLCVGMETTAEVLREIGQDEDAEWIAKDAETYRREILRSMDEALIEKHGIKFLPVLPISRELILQSDFQTDNYYGLLLSMMLEMDFFDPSGPRAQRLVDALEKRGGVTLGCLAWRGGIDHAYLLGYLHNRLENNEPEKAILGLYGWMAYGMSRTTYSGVEINNHRVGDNHATLPHSFSSTEQLRLLREMLVREEDNRLILGQAIPRHWLEPGKSVRIARCPTRFGKVDYSIEAKKDRMTVLLVPPARQTPGEVAIYLRHPQERAIGSVLVDDEPWPSFTSDRILLSQPGSKCRIEVKFE